jgi:hypothetical protein
MQRALLDGRPRSLRPILLVLVAMLIASAWSGGARAFAAGEAHPFLFSFGAFTNPNGIAVEESTGDVYVADIGTNTVSRFDANGNPVEFPALHSNTLSGGATPAGSFSFPNVYGTPAAVTVDGSSDPSDPSRGDLYVMDAGHGVIDKFSPDGTYVSQITGPFENELMGLAIDANGNVHVAESSTSLIKVQMIALFDNATTNNFIKQLATPGGGETLDTIAVHTPTEHSFALSPTGDQYMLFKCGCTEKLGSTLIGLGLVDEEGAGDVAMAVDPVTGHLYVDKQSSVAEFDTGGMNGYEPNPLNRFQVFASAALVSSFGMLQFSGVAAQQGGIAVNGSSGEVYVSNPADGKVYVFASVPPAVAAGAAGSVSQTGATLQGSVDPRRVPVVSCEFEYEKAEANPGNGHEFDVPVTAFAHSVPCVTEHGEPIGSGASAVGVSAAVGGLDSGALYYFRLVAGNANGAGSSEGMFATADSGFGIKSFSVAFLNRDGTPDTQAGSHPYEMVTSFAFKTRVRREVATADSPYLLAPVGNPKDILVVPPAGLAGNPNATEAKCTIGELETNGSVNGGVSACSSGSQVGLLYVETPSYGTGSYLLYNMVAPRGVAAQFGAHVIFPNAFIDSSLQTGGDYPYEAGSLDITAIEPIFRIRTTLFGVVGSGEHRRAFLTLPTGCTGPLHSTISVDSYQDPGHYASKSEIMRNASGEPVPLTGCSKLQFPPAISVAPDVADASSSSGLTVGVHVPQTSILNPDGLAESAVRDTTVALPAGVTLNPAGSDGLSACSEAQAGFRGFEEFNPEFEPGVKWATFAPFMPGVSDVNPTPVPAEAIQPGVNTCPDGSKIGTVKLKTPLLPDPLEGDVYVATQNQNPFGSLIAMYMVIQDPVSGTTVKLAGEVHLCESAGQVINGVSCQAQGQIITAFKNTPDQPFEDLSLHFFGGERAPLATPSRCGTYTTRAVFAPWDGNTPVETTSSFVIEHGPNGTPCPGPSLPFEPYLAAGSTSNQAGGFSPFTMTMSREDGQQTLQSVSLKMPPGLSGMLTGIELCGEAQADKGTCPPGSLIGETTVSVGVGNDPFSVKGGRVYLTGPYRGAPFGLSIVNPAKAGPYDVEKDTSNPNYDSPCDCIVVRAKIEVDPLTADLTVTSDNEGPYKIPTILDGIPLQIKHVNVTITRPGFTFNPTNCSPLSITGAIDSTEGSSNPVSVPFQATNCARLSFKPRFEVSTSGRTSRADGASLHVRLSYPRLPFGSQANIKSVKVDLPRQLPSRLNTLQKACPDSVFAANPAGCPAASRVGHARASTPILPVELEGPAYFVSHGGQKFPELIVVLQGYGVTVYLHGETFISKGGITSSTFHTVPDVPVGTFELNLPEGPYSALAAPGGVCSATRTVLVRRRIRVKTANGTARTVTRRVRKTLATGLVMPTLFIAQNGAVIHQSTPIAVTGCARHKNGKAQRHKTRKGKG